MADEKNEKETPKEAPKEAVEEKEAKKEETKERTKKNFDKLKKSNKELKKKVVEYENVLDSLKPPTPKPPQPQVGMGPGMTTYSEPREKTDQVPQAEQFSTLKQDQIDDVFQGMMDEQGYLDGRKLMDTLKAMDIRARRAEERAARAELTAQDSRKTQRDFEEDLVVRRVHRKYPQLDPKNDEFSQELFDSVRNELIGQLMKGQKEDLEAATKKWYNRLYKEEDMPTKKEKEEQEKKVEAKEQIASAQPRSSIMKGYYDDYEEKQLREDIKYGKKGALAEVLRRSGN